MGAICHICDSNTVSLAESYTDLFRVTSDCKPFNQGGKLGKCNSCYCTINPTDVSWQQETDAIYRDYSLYPLGAGSEPSSFDGSAMSSRSSILINKLQDLFDFSRPGRLLDVGCSNGGFFRCFSKYAPLWKMVGFEVSDYYRAEVEAIPGVEAFYEGSLERISGQFDLITLVHVFEHLPTPVKWLECLRKLLTPTGRLLIQVPDCSANPFDLVVADHCSHFTITTLTQLLRRNGFEVSVGSDEWISKELTILAGRSEILNDTHVLRDDPRFSPFTSVEWLLSLTSTIVRESEDENFGVFGSSIAATWVAAILGDRLKFFVDEEPTRVGKNHLGKPILAPSQVPQNSTLFVCLAPVQAERVAKRMSTHGFKVVVPSPVPTPVEKS